jgi:DNA-binding response OmpR family regulator
MEQNSDLTRSDIAILGALVSNKGRIMSRSSLLKQAGLQSFTERRCDASLVTLRRALGPDSIVTVRQRGWMLSENALMTAMTLLASIADKL